jgi:hypothetical protein
VVGNTTVSSTDWTELTGQFTVPDDCDSTSFQVYAEGSAAGVDLYVDDVSVTLLPSDDTSGTDTSGTDVPDSGTDTMDPSTTGDDVDSGVMDTSGMTEEWPDGGVDASSTEPVDTSGEVVTEPDASVTTDVMTSDDVDTSTAEETTSAADTTEPELVNLVSNSGFETGTSGWSSWMSTIAPSTDQFRTGLQSLYVSGMDANLAATEVSVEAGLTYNISLWARIESDGLANIRVVVNLPGCINYAWVVGNTPVGDDGWTELSGSFAVPVECVATTAQIFPEAGATMVNFYIDDVVVTEGVN